MKLTRICLFVIAYLLTIVSVNAQKVKTVSGEYTMYCPETMSIDDAKRAALEQAKIDALSAAFGTIVNQSNTTVMSNNNGESNVKFQSLSGSDVKGEWISDIDAPVYTITQGDHVTIVTCKVKGKAREISGARVQYEVVVLRNGKDKRFQSVEFKDGDDMYMYFMSPVDGYLSVFLLDETSQIVYSILPYRRDKRAVFPIERNKEYILFSIDDAAPDFRNEVDEYQLGCDGDKEYNTLYVLFSTDKIYRGSGYDVGDSEIPENIPFIEFRSRLGKLLAHNPNIQFSQISLVVTK